MRTPCKIRILLLHTFSFLFPLSQLLGKSFATEKVSALPVSFFGSSFINLRFQEASSSSDIFFRLRTQRADSMLFLVTGRTDYCLLVLDAGRLKVHINLGAGETEIASEAPFLLNDMKWHSVNLTRKGSQLAIRVDKHLTKASLPNRFQELNIHFGIWVGGLNGFNEIFLGNLPSFRGCLSQLSYNGDDVLQRAKTQPGQTMSGVKMGCSEEFDATTGDPLTLFSAHSYTISRVAISRQGTVVKMNVRPMKNDGLIFYVGGMSSRPDYLAVELKFGKVRFVAEMGSGPIQVESPKNISDRLWHSVAIKASPSALYLMVDNHSWTSEPQVRGSRHLDVSELVYLGIEESKRALVRSLGLVSTSFQGCIQDLHIDGKAYGLPEFDVSHNVTRHCVLEKERTRACEQDLNSESCSSSKKIEEGKEEKRDGLINGSKNASIGSTGNGNSFGGAYNGRPDGTITNPTNSNSLEVITIARDVIRIVTQTEVGELEIMRVSPVHVAEGDSVIITPRHLAITLDLTKFGIRESGVLFKIRKRPMYGRIEVTTRSASSASLPSMRSETFSWLDVGAGRIRYWHNGAESSHDSLQLVLRLVERNGYLLPAYLQDERTITLPIEITAVNDPPTIQLVPGSVLRLAEGTKTRLTPEVITALDPDTLSADLSFSLISMGTSAKDQGYLEYSSSPGKAIQNFTQEDLRTGRVWYCDQGRKESKIALKVTDGSSISSTAILRVETFALRLAPEVNTGIEVANVMGASGVITNLNLSFTSNAGDQGLVIQYHIINPPKAGILQLRRSNSQWSRTDQFSQSDLQAQQLRYLLQHPGSSDRGFEDEFTFHVSLSERKVPSEFRFRLKVMSLRLQQRGLNIVHMNNTIGMTLSEKALEYRTIPLSVSTPRHITYTIVSKPRFGFLQLRSSKSRSTSRLQSIGGGGGDFSKTLGVLDTFKQNDVEAKKLYFQFKLTPYSPVMDYFLFNVSSSHLDLTLMSGPFRFDIYHFTDLKPAQASIQPIIVTEGSSTPIKSDNLRILKSVVANPILNFNITDGPTHGVLRIKSGLQYAIGLKHFSSRDLDKKVIYYDHDGTESPRDQAHLVAWNKNQDFMFACQLDIIVRGVNNHAPTRAPYSTHFLNVVTHGSKRLSSKVLSYIDEDWDADASSLKYSVTGSTYSSTQDGIGYIFDPFISKDKPIFQWTQADVSAGRLIFKHNGPQNEGFLHFLVSDGKFVLNGTMRISAGAPWVNIVDTKGLVTKKGSMAPLAKNSITVDTNVDVDESQLFIRIEDPPKHGVIRVNASVCDNFTIGDVEHGRVVYENNESSFSHKDMFTFRAAVDDVGESEVQQFHISIYPEAYWSPLKIEANHSIAVRENASVVVPQTALNIMNALIPPSDIVYSLTRSPKHGYLAVDPASAHGLEDVSPDYVKMWDQTVINEGRLRYVQSQPNKTTDSMEFDVTNGVQILRNLRLDIVVIPTNLMLISRIIHVDEGNTVSLNITHLHSAQPYFSDKLTEIKVLERGKHGILALASRPKMPISTFPYKALHDEKVLYVHDGSESLRDRVKVVGVAKSHGEEPRTWVSEPHDIEIKVIPLNDHVPKVVNNTGTWVWAGGFVPITNENLAAIDVDSEVKKLIFYVVGSHGGYPTFKATPNHPLKNFTQKQINESEILFFHKGIDLSEASFDFEVSDGLNEASKDTFKVTVAKPQLKVYDDRAPLSVFPLTQAPLRDENILVTSSDERNVGFQIKKQPRFGQVLIEGGENKFLPISSFTQQDISSGKIFYHHTKAVGGQKANDSIRLSATSSFSDSLEDVVVNIDISVEGASSGGLQRYIALKTLKVHEGNSTFIDSSNINCSAVLDFISSRHKGIIWEGGPPLLHLLLSELPQHGWLNERISRRLNIGHEIPMHLLKESAIIYQHDDSETTSDSIGFSLWLETKIGRVSDEINLSSVNQYDRGNEWTWLVNVTLPIIIIPVNDQPFQFSPQKGHITPVVQEHWRKLSRKDLLTSDPDTPPAHIVYEILRLSHGRFLLLPKTDETSFEELSFHRWNDSYDNNENWSESYLNIIPGDKKYKNHSEQLDPSYVRRLPAINKFTQADVDAGDVLYYHTGPVSLARAKLSVTDGRFKPKVVQLNIPIQRLSLKSSQEHANPLLMPQGETFISLNFMNLPCTTNGNLMRLKYNITRFPLHGKLLHHKRKMGSSEFTHDQLITGKLGYLQTDMSVANDSFEVSGRFMDPDLFHVATTWLVNVVSLPLLKRIKEVRTFVSGFAVGGIVAPDESMFSAVFGSHTTVNLAVLDASPLAAITGANPIYEIEVPPKHGQLYKVPPPSVRYKRYIQRTGRIASRFSHEDIRRGSIIYYSHESSNNKISTFSKDQKAPPVQSDEFIFKVFAPDVQPAMGIAKFHVSSDLDELKLRKHHEIISDGSTDPATKMSGPPTTLKDITHLVTPRMTQDSLVTLGVVAAGVLTLTIFLVLAIKVTCSKKSSRRSGRGGGSADHSRNSRNRGNPNSMNNGATDANKPHNGLGIIDAYAPSTTCTLVDPCQSDSDTGFRPSRHNDSSNTNSTPRAGTTVSDSGSWTSSVLRNEIPTPSVPQCRITPLCNSSDSGGGCGGANTLAMCPLLPPAPICDTFATLPEDIEPSEPYGFSYGTLIPPPLDIQSPEEETPFSDFAQTKCLTPNIVDSMTQTPASGGMTSHMVPRVAPLNPSTPSFEQDPVTQISERSDFLTGNASDISSVSGTPGFGTLRKRQGKNQYWV